jgi:hypothetical protein
MRAQTLVAAGLAAACALALPAAAEIVVAETEAVCFGRGYQWAEVDAAPPRRVVRLGLSLENWDGDLYFGFEVTFVDRPGLVFGAGGLCRAQDAGYMCADDGDGGIIHVAPAEDGGVAIRWDEYGMRVYSAAFETAATADEHGEFHPDGIDSLRAADAMPVHHLVPLPPEVCN